MRTAALLTTAAGSRWHSRLHTGRVECCSCLIRFMGPVQSAVERRLHACCPARDAVLPSPSPPYPAPTVNGGLIPESVEGVAPGKAWDVAGAGEAADEVILRSGSRMVAAAASAAAIRHRPKITLLWHKLRQGTGKPLAPSTCSSVMHSNTLAHPPASPPHPCQPTQTLL